MLYELATIDIKFGAGPDVAKAVTAWSNEPHARGNLLGMFATDVGALNQVYVLRAFESIADLHVERLRAMNSSNPYNSGNLMLGLSIEGFAPFPFLPPVKPAKLGGTYEFRAYKFKTGGLPQTLGLWEKWVPGRLELSPLVVAMYALDGPPRFTHIWPYADAGARSRTRAEAVAKGVWPPKGGPDWLFDMRSTLTVPLPGSPLA